MIKKKISINGKFFGAPGTGVQRVAEEIIESLDHLLENDNIIASQFDVEIITPTDVKVNYTPKKISIRKKGILSGLVRNIPWEQLNLPFITNDRTLVSLCNLAPIALKNSIVMIHDAQVHYSPKSYSFGFRCWYKFIQPILGHRSKQIITVSEHSKKQLVEYQVAPSDKITVIHNGVDHVLRTTADDTLLEKLNIKNKPYFIAQANTQAHKNISILLKAFSSKQLNDATLVLYGSENKFKFESKGMAVPHNVIFAGRVSDGELKSLYMHAVATLTPSLTEGFGLQPLEGMILGTPAIVAPCGALPEVCGDVALYADPNNDEQWVTSIRNLIDDKPLTKEMKLKSETHGLYFTWKSSANKLLSLLLTQV